MLRAWFGFALTGILCILSIPLLAVSLVVAAFCTGAIAVYSPFRKQPRRIDSGAREAWAANEFGFEHAIEAYEELIDTHTGQRP